MTEQWSWNDEDGVHPWDLWCQQFPQCEPAEPPTPETPAERVQGEAGEVAE